MREGAGAETSDAVLARLLECAPVTVLVVDQQGTITWAGGATEWLSGFTPEDLVGTNALQYIDTKWSRIAMDSIGAALVRSGLQRPMLFRLWRKDGSAYVAEMQANTQFDDPAVQGMVVYIRRCDERVLLDDVVESVAAGAELDDTLTLLSRVMGAETLEADGLVFVEPQRDRFARGLSAVDLPARLMVDDGRRNTPWNEARASGRPAWAAVDDLPATYRDVAAGQGYRWCWAWPVRRGTDVVACLVIWRRDDEKPDHTCSMVLDNLARLAGLVVDQEHNRVKLRHAALHDPLTGLPNRARFLEHLEGIVADGPGPLVGVLYVDLDEFKQVNDALGHAAGDEVLRASARRLEGAVRELDLVARLGGDEFAIACHGLEHCNALEAVATRVTETMRTPIAVGADQVVVGASVGIAYAVPGSCSVDELLEAADSALYRVKGSGRGTWSMAGAAPAAS